MNEPIYRIKWTNKRDTSRQGTSKIDMSHAQAITLADELNEEYPNFSHVPFLYLTDGQAVDNQNVLVQNGTQNPV